MDIQWNSEALSIIKHAFARICFLDFGVYRFVFGNVWRHNS